ncbi:MAG: hypothetical protein K6L73_04440 [Cellvibrionaceae bacterium]
MFKLFSFVVSLSIAMFSLGALAEQTKVVDQKLKSAKKIETITTDPTRPLKWQATAAGKYQKQLTLNSVLISESRKVAIINGRRVKVSGMVDGAKVIAIRNGEVVVSRNGARQTLKLKPNPVKRVVRK